jgi:hypothetical protein
MSLRDSMVKDKWPYCQKCLKQEAVKVYISQGADSGYTSYACSWCGTQNGVSAQRFGD